MNRYLLCAMHAALVLSACVADVQDVSVHEAPETVTTPKGGVFVRADLWDPVERARMRKLSAASLLPGATLEEIAEGVRGVMQHSNGRIYIQEELDYELARLIQEEEKYELDAPVPSTSFDDGAVAGRHVIGSDDRTNASLATGGWQAAVMFSSKGCSGTRIGQHTAVTAAHCIFKTAPAFPNDTDIDGWWCIDGSISANEDTACPDFIYPHWRFGVDGTAGHSNWVHVLPGFEGWPVCAKVIIPQSFIDDTGLGWLTARHDYAVVDFSSCPASTWPNGWAAFGTTTRTDSQLAAMTAFAAGYPFLTGCMNGSNGNSNVAPWGDCIGGTQQYNGGGAPPVSSAELFLSSSSDITAGPEQSAYTISSKADVTVGQSGGPLFFFDFASGMQLIGILSQGSSDANANRYRRWTNSLHNWVADHSLFPDD